MSEWYNDEVFRALLGTISVIGGWLCFTYCCYKFALFRKKEEKRIQTIIVSPSQSASTKIVCSSDDKKYSSLV